MTLQLCVLPQENPAVRKGVRDESQLVQVSIFAGATLPTTVAVRQADDVPMTPGGTAVIEAVAIPNTDNGGNGTGSSGGTVATMASKRKTLGLGRPQSLSSHPNEKKQLAHHRL